MARRSRSARPLAVALAVAVALSACGAGDDVVDTDGAGTIEGAATVVGTDALKFEPTSLTAEAGEVAIELTCEPAVAHNLIIEERDEKVAECNGGGTDAGTVELEAGDYTYYCDLPGHRAAGMEGTLTVS